MPINQLVSYCIQKYSKPGRCSNCQNDCKCLNTDDCYECLKYIHNISTTDRTYNCNNIIYNYVIKHIYRYSSEIERLLDSYEAFKNCQNYKVCSIGSGPCSELFGIKQFIKKNNIQPGFSFIGFEKNKQWSTIQKKISEILGANITFSNEDVFSYFEQHSNDMPNILILNYVLSDIVKYNRDGVEEFIRNLLDLFEKMPNSCLIINDISYIERDISKRNSWKAVNYMNNLRDVLVNNSTDKYYNYNHYFVPQTGSGAIYGKQHNSKLLTSSIIDSAYLFNPFIYCGSFQLIIIKQKIK